MSIETIAVQIIRLVNSGDASNPNAQSRLKADIQSWAIGCSKLMQQRCGLEIVRRGQRLQTCVWIGGRDCPVYASRKSLDESAFTKALIEAGLEPSAISKYVNGCKTELLLQ